MIYGKSFFYVFIVLLSGVFSSCSDHLYIPDDQPDVRLKKVIRDYSIDNYVYDAQNKLLSIIHRPPTDSTQITYRQDYTYDQAGLLKDEVSTNGSASTQNHSRKVDFEYNGSGQIVREVYFTDAGQLEPYQIDSVFYDAQGRIIKRKLVRKYDIQSSTLEYVYNIQNNVETIYHTFITYPDVKSTKSFRAKTNYTYDTLMNPFYRMVGTPLIEYSSQNNRTEEVSYSTYEMSGDLETVLKSVEPTNQFYYSYQYKDSLPILSVVNNINTTKYIYEAY